MSAWFISNVHNGTLNGCQKIVKTTFRMPPVPMLNRNICMTIGIKAEIIYHSFSEPPCNVDGVSTVGGNWCDMEINTSKRVYPAVDIINIRYNFNILDSIIKSKLGSIYRICCNLSRPRSQQYWYYRFKSLKKHGDINRKDIQPESEFLLESLNFDHLFNVSMVYQRLLKLGVPINSPLSTSIKRCYVPHDMG